ncbi:MAG: HIT family protein [Planctomycetota bacterium]
MADCIFCKIIEGAIPSTPVVCDDAVCVFMDINPLHTGHILVVPLVHAGRLGDLDAATGGRMFQAAMRAARALRASGLPCDGVNFHLADGRAAGQEVGHLHLHVIPRTNDDGLGFKHPPGYPHKATPEELGRAAAMIKARLEQ